MIDGILLVDKEEGITSYDVIRKLKRFLPHKQKIGHGGTLDPFATGLLVILLGRATKLMNTIHSMNKVYEVVGEFGYETDTQDPTGKVTEKIKELKSVPEEDINQSLILFLGDIEQMPPKFSAKKVKGKRAYDLAREGKKFELKPKEVTIESFEITDYQWPKISFLISCSTGTYVRTLITDLGKELETYGTAIELRRTEIGDFKIENAIKSISIGNGDLEDEVISLEGLEL